MEGTRAFTMDELWAWTEEIRAMREEGLRGEVSAAFEAGRPITMDDFNAWSEEMEARKKKEGRSDYTPEEFAVWRAIGKTVEANGGVPFKRTAWWMASYEHLVRTHGKEKADEILADYGDGEGVFAGPGFIPGFLGWLLLPVLMALFGYGCSALLGLS